MSFFLVSEASDQNGRVSEAVVVAVAVDHERVVDNVYCHASSHISSFDDFSCLSGDDALDFYDMQLDKFSLSRDEPLDLYHEIALHEFNMLGDGGTVEKNNEYDNAMGVSSMPESGQKCEVPLISTLLSPSGSHSDSNNEPIAKRSRTGCGYTIEDVIKKLPRSSSVGNGVILQNTNFPVVNRFHSPKFSVSSLSSNSLIGSKENVA